MHIHSFTLQSLSVDDVAEMLGSRKTESTGQFHQQYTMIRHLQTNTHTHTHKTVQQSQLIQLAIILQQIKPVYGYDEFNH